MEQYIRHKNLYSDQEFQKIKNTKLLIVGAGGLGSNVLQLAIRFGFGEIHLYDSAILDMPDLNRQILYSHEDLGYKKADLANEKLRQINPDVNIYSYAERFTAETQLPRIDIAIDCLDTIESRIVLEEQTFEKNIPMVHAGVYKHFGQLTTLIKGKTKSYRETFGIGDEYEEQGKKDIYPPVVSLIASLEVSEAVKIAAGRFDELLLNKLLTVDLNANLFTTINL